MRAQDLSFVNYSTKEGMSSAQVYQIMQDKNGDMLFATDRGITKYDGSEFQTFELADGLTNTTVFSFFPQADGKIWCSTIDNSWFYFQNGTTQFTKCEYNELIQKSSKGGLVHDIWISSTGEFHFGFEDIQDYLAINSLKNEVIQPLLSTEGLYDTLQAIFIEKENGEMFKYYHRKNRGEDSWKANVKMVIEQPRNRIGYKRIEYINGSYLFSSYKYLIIKQEKQSQIELEFDSRVTGIGQYDKDHFWVGLYEGGIKVFDMSGKETNHWLKGKSVTYLIKDINGGIWISTLSNGVFHAQNDNIKYYEKLENTYITSISPGRAGEPLISTLDKHFQIENNTLLPIDVEKNQPSHKAIFNRVKNKYQSRLLPPEITLKEANIRGPSIVDFSENNDTSLVVSSPYNFFVQNGNRFLEYAHPSRITAIEIAKEGCLVGGYSGISYVKTGTLENVLFNFPSCSGRIKDIKRKGAYHYIATNENGLVRWQENGNRFLHITKANGLASNLINEVFAETESILWVATNKGLDRIIFNGEQYSIVHFGVEHGLIDNDVTDVYVNNDIVWIGTRSGLCSISKNQIGVNHQNIGMNLFWSLLKVNGNEIPIPKEWTFSYDENNLELDFHSAFYGGSSRVKYRYKIDENSDTWFDLTSRQILLNNLQSGEYNLILQANVDDSNWTDNQLSLSFTVTPPFYRTWWFRLFILFSFSGLIYLFFKMRFLIYNKSLVKEALRLVIRKLNPQQKTLLIQEQGVTHRINSNDVLFLNSDGNYLIIQLKEKKHVIRYKIGDYPSLVPDKLEYMRVHKSYVVRLDKISSKNIDTIIIEQFQIPIGKTYKLESKYIDDLIFSESPI